jgi:hypothetical protein
VKWKDECRTQLSEKGLLTEEYFPGLDEAQKLGCAVIESLNRFFVGALSHLTGNTGLFFENSAGNFFTSNPSFVPIKTWMQEVLDTQKQLQRHAIIIDFVKSHSMKWNQADSMKAWRVKTQEKLLGNLKARCLFQEDTTLSFATFPFLKDKGDDARLEYTVAALILKSQLNKNIFSQSNYDFFGFTAPENGGEELNFFSEHLEDELVNEIPNDNLFPISDVIALSSDIVQHYHDLVV